MNKLKWSSHDRPVAAEKPFEMAINWLSGSGEPAAENQSCMRYSFNNAQAVTNYLNSLLYLSILFFTYISGNLRT